MADNSPNDKALLRRLQSRLAAIQHLPEADQVTWVITMFAFSCGLAAAQPIPFADILILTPIQVGMATLLAKVRRVPLTKQGAAGLVKEVGRVVGLGVLAQHGTIGLYKFIPYLGSFTTIPIVFTSTYIIGRVIDAHLVARREGRSLTGKVIEMVRASAGEEAAKLIEPLKNIKNLREAIEYLQQMMHRTDAAVSRYHDEVVSIRAEMARQREEIRKNPTPSELDYQRIADLIRERVDAVIQEQRHAELETTKKRLAQLPFWQDLEEDSRIFLTVGEYLWAQNSPMRELPADVDFSPISLEYAKVVETELKAWATHLKQVVTKRVRLNLDDFPPAPMVDGMAGRVDIHRLTPADLEDFLRHLFRRPQRQSAGHHKLATELNRAFADQTLPEGTRLLPDFICDVRHVYRNGAVHTETLKADVVTKFRERLLGDAGQPGMIEHLLTLKRWPH